MDSESRRPLGWKLVALVAAIIGAVQVVALVVWLMRTPEPSMQALLGVPWLLVWYWIALGALHAARRQPGLPR